MVKQGHRAVIFFCVQRNDASSFQAAEKIDSVSAQALREVTKFGVEVLAYARDISPESVVLTHPLIFK